MLNPFSMLNFVYTVAKDAPDPINIQFEEPSLNLLPIELTKKVKVDGFYISQLWIDNLSKRVLENVRINLTSPLEFAPIVRTNKRHGEVDFTYDEIKMELLITRLDPTESLKISFFPDLKRIKEFEEPQIIIGDQALSSLMLQLGLYKKYPQLLVVSIQVFFTLILFVFTLGFVTYLNLRDSPTFFPNSEYTQIRQARERLSTYSCSFVSEVNTKELKKKLQSGPPYHIPTIIKMNGVDFESELWNQDRIAYLKCGK